MNFVIFGANGFIGSRLGNYLIKLGHTVFAIYNKKRSNICSEAYLVNLLEFKSVSESIDAVYFMAGSYASTYQELIDINTNLLRDVSIHFPKSKLIFISSTDIYGFHKDVLDIESCYNNPSNYGLSKIAGELVVRNHSSYAIIRLCYTYGPQMRNNSFIPNIIKQAIENRKIVIYGSGDRFQDYLFIDDALDLCYLSFLYDSNDIFIGATGLSISNKIIAEIVVKRISGSSIEYLGQETGNSIYINPAKTFSKLDWKPKIPIETGINLTIDACANLW